MKTKTTINIDSDLFVRIKVLSAKTKKPIYYYIEEALKHILEVEEKKIKEGDKK
jgi:predicted transcriptional regulator